MTLDIETAARRAAAAQIVGLASYPRGAMIQLRIEEAVTDLSIRAFVLVYFANDGAGISERNEAAHPGCRLDRIPRLGLLGLAGAVAALVPPEPR